MSIPNITECRECGSKSLTWATHNKTVPGIQDGRLRGHDVSCVFVLGCDECSETLAVVSSDKIAAHLTASAEPSAREAQALQDEKRLGIERLPAEQIAPVGQGYVDPNRSEQGGLPKPSAPVDPQQCYTAIGLLNEALQSGGDWAFYVRPLIVKARDLLESKA